MSSENLIHVMFDYSEGIELKRSNLNLQQSLLRTSRFIKNYKVLRIQELKLKEKARKKLKETKDDLDKLSKTVPRIHLPEILKSHFHEDSSRKELKIKAKTSKDFNEDEDLDEQIREIQNKLKSLKI